MTSRPTLSDLLNASPGTVVGTALILRNESAKLPGRKGRKGKGDAAAGPWGRVLSADGGRVVLAFSLPCSDLSPNGAKGRWRAKGKATKALRAVARDAAAEAMEAAGIAGPWERATASERWFFPHLRKRDRRNFEHRMKPVYDGLTDAGLWWDDAADFLNHLPGDFMGIDRANPRVEITLERRA